MDIQLLISTVGRRQNLWDASQRDYADKNKKHAAWIEVSKCVFENFTNESEQQQKLMKQEVISKWRTVRDNYVRKLKRQDESSKSGYGAKKIKSYVYGEQLSFLKKTLKARATTSSVQNDPPPVEIAEDEDFKTEVPTPERSTVPSPEESRKKKVTGIELSLVEFMETQNKKKLSAEEDEDLAFFFLPTVKTLTPDEKFSFRFKAMELLQNIKRSRKLQPD